MLLPNLGCPSERPTRLEYRCIRVHSLSIFLYFSLSFSLSLPLFLFLSLPSHLPSLPPSLPLSFMFSLSHSISLSLSLFDTCSLPLSRSRFLGWLLVIGSLADSLFRLLSHSHTALFLSRWASLWCSMHLVQVFAILIYSARLPVLHNRAARAFCRGVFLARNVMVPKGSPPGSI